MKYFRDRSGNIGIFDDTGLLVKIKTASDHIDYPELVGKLTWEDVMNWKDGKELTEKQAFVELL